MQQARAAEQEAKVSRGRARASGFVNAGLHAAMVIGALWLFVLALQLIKTGAGGEVSTQVAGQLVALYEAWDKPDKAQEWKARKDK